MGIFQVLPVQIADVKLNDDYRVELEQFRLVTDYTPTQARTLAGLLTRCADAAELATKEDAVTPIGRGQVKAEEVL